MNLTFWIANRLNLKPQDKKQRSPGVTIAVAGVAIAITVMMIAIAVVMGFKNSIKEKLLGLESAIAITAAQQNPQTHNTFIPSRELIASISSKLPAGATISASVQTTALLKTQDDYLGITLRSNTPQSPQEEYIRNSVVSGTYPDYSDPIEKNSIVVSETTARLLGINPGSNVYLHFFVDNGVRSRKAKVAAIYDTSFSERDKYLVIASSSIITSAQKIPQGSVSAINVSGDIPDDEIPALTETLQETLLQNIYDENTDRLLIAEGIRQRAAMYYNWLDLLDTNVVVIIILMGLVAAFTLISCLLILILERIQLIGILKSIGATTSQIQRIFVAIALRIVMIGLVIGNIAGLAILLLQRSTNIIPLDPQAYFLDSVPVEIIPWQIVTLNVCAVIVAAAVLIIPTTIISAISPATTIKYE